MSPAGGFLTATDLELWRKLSSLFGSLSVPLAEGYDRTVQRQVVPTVDVMGLDVESLGISATLSLTTGAFASAGTVPTGKTWEVTAIHVGATTGTDRQLVFIDDAGGDHTFGASSATELFIIPCNFWLGPGWQIGRNGTGNGADSARGFNFMYREHPAPPYNA